MVEMTGYSRDELLGEPYSLLFSEIDAEHEMERLQDREDDLVTFESVLRSSDGRTIPCELRVSRLLTEGDCQGTVGIVRNLSEQGFPPTPEWTQRSGDVLSTILEKIHGGIFVLDEEFEIVRTNETIGQYFGVDPSALVGRDKRDVVDEVMRKRVADPDRFADRVLSAYDNNAYVDKFTCEITAGENREGRWLNHWSKPIESGPFAGGRVEIYTEGTAQKKTADALRETEERFHSLVDAVEEYAIFRLDPHGRVVSWNEGARKIKGYEAAEILGEHISQFYTESDRASGVPEQNLADALEKGSIEDEGWRVRKDGTQFWANVTITALRDDGTHQGYLKVTRDMTDRHRHEQEIESELQRILERISDAFYALDEEWRFTHVNERAEELLQQPREELLGERLWDMFPEATDTSVWDRYQEAMDIQEPVSFDLEYDVLDIWVEVTAYPSESGLSVYFRDITDRVEAQRRVRDREQQLEEYEAYTTEILNSIDDLFYVIDTEKNFQRWNASVSTVTGYTDEEIRSMDPADLFVEEDRETIHNGIETVFETGSTRIEATILTKGGQRVPMEFAASAVVAPDGETMLAGIGRDITERIERERALEASNERLERFAHAASHDLQEPLRMVSSYLRLIERRYGDELDADGQEFLEFAVDGADRMREMIDGLLTYSRVESQGTSFEAVDLDDVYANTCDNLRIAIREHDAEITSESLPVVEGDERQLRQLLQNLLENAIEYSGDEPPRIHVAAERNEIRGMPEWDTTVTSEADQWTISVRDEGIGVDPDDHERIFQVFQSLDGPDSQSSGIGLALCKRIVERHGGDIWIDSTPGEGATISFTLSGAKRDHD